MKSRNLESVCFLACSVCCFLALIICVLVQRSKAEELEWIVDEKLIERVARIEYKQQLEEIPKNDVVKRAALTTVYRDGKEYRKQEELWRWIKFPAPEVGRIPRIEIYVDQIIDESTFVGKQAPDQRDFSVPIRMGAGGPTQGIQPGRTRTYSYGSSIVKGKKYPGVVFKGWSTKRFKVGSYQKLSAGTIRIKYNSTNARFVQRIKE